MGFGVEDRTNIFFLRGATVPVGHHIIITIARLIVDDSHHKDFSKGHFSYKTDRNVKWEKQFQSDC